VRLEVETALRRNVLVIPVLVDGAEMPDASDLPDSMKDFVYRSAVIVASGQDFHMHVDRLIRSIDQMLAANQATPGSQPAIVPSIVPVPPAGEREYPVKVDPPASMPPIKPPVENREPTAEPKQPVEFVKPVTLFGEPDPTGNIADLVPPPARGPAPAMPASNRRIYLAAVAASLVLLFAGYGVIAYSRGEEPQLASYDPPKVAVAHPAGTAPIPIPAAAPRVHTADTTATIPAASAAIPEKRVNIAWGKDGRKN
jgi:hypothetical protein